MARNLAAAAGPALSITNLVPTGKRLGSPLYFNAMAPSCEAATSQPNV